MSFLEGPKTRLTSIAAALAVEAAARSSLHLKPGCVQCGRLLDVSDRRKVSFSGKCYSCEHWISDEEEEVEELED